MHAGPLRAHGRAREDRRRARTGQGGLRAAAVLPLELAVHGLSSALQAEVPFGEPGALLGVEHDARHPPHGRHDARVHRQGPELHPRRAAVARRRRRHRSTFAFGNEASEADIREFAAPLRLRRCATATAPPRGSSSSAATRRCRPARSARPTTPSACSIPTPATECPRAEFDARGPAANAEAAVGEIVNMEPGDDVRGLLPQRGGQRLEGARRHLLVGRPRVPRRRRLVLLRRSLERVAARRRRELRRRAGRAHRAARTRACGRPRCTRCPTTPSATA